VANKTAQSISGAMQFVQISDDPLAVGGFLTMSISGQFINITAAVYPGIPGDPGYSEAAEDKYNQVITALDIAAEGAALKAKIDSVASMGDISELLGPWCTLGQPVRRDLTLLEFKIGVLDSGTNTDEANRFCARKIINFKQWTFVTNMQIITPISIHIQPCIHLDRSYNRNSYMLSFSLLSCSDSTFRC
jgi:hypothetical protein